MKMESTPETPGREGPEGDVEESTDPDDRVIAPMTHTEINKQVTLKAGRVYSQFGTIIEEAAKREGIAKEAAEEEKTFEEKLADILRMELVSVKSVLHGAPTGFTIERFVRMLYLLGYEVDLRGRRVSDRPLQARPTGEPNVPGQHLHNRPGTGPAGGPKDAPES